MGPTGPVPVFLCSGELGEGLGGAAAEIGVEHPRDLARAVARCGDRIANQATGAEAKERSIDAELANLANQLDRAGGVGTGAAEHDRSRVESTQGTLEPLIAEL